VIGGQLVLIYGRQLRTNLTVFKTKYTIVHMSQPKKLTWNSTQTQIYDLLKAGMMPIKVAKQLGVDKSSVTKVSNAMKKGQSPVTPYIPHLKKTKHPISPVETESNNEAELAAINQQLTPANKQEMTPSGDASVLNLKPVTIECAMTPIMLIARNTAITELGWPEDVAWEDFLDTVLVHCFKYWGFGLQGVYKLNDKDNGSFSKPSSEKTGGLGNTNDELNAKALKLGLAAMEIFRSASNQTIPN
jgi:hypothetical protein